MIINLALLIACLLPCGYGLLNCHHPDSKKVTLIYNGTSVHACRNGEEQLEGCLINYVFDNESHVFFVPTKYMKETYEHIWSIYNYTESRYPGREMFEERSRMYEDCAEMLDLMVMQGHPYTKFDMVLEHFRTAYKPYMPDGEIPQKMEPEPIKEEKASFYTADETRFSASDDEDDDEFDYRPPRYVKYMPIYNISLCNIQVIHNSETYLVHSSLSMHYCDPEHHNFTFVTCSDTSRPEQTLKCISISDDEMDKAEIAFNQSTLVEEIKNNNLPHVVNFMKLSEVWDARLPCKQTMVEMRKRNYNPVFEECFSRQKFEKYVLKELSESELDQPMEAFSADPNGKQRSNTDL